ncbi:hypothetical protein JCM19992_01150 [Thermostilla marina]
MPTSEPRTLSVVHDIILRLAPASVIDVGVGHGKTGVLVREFTDIWAKNYHRESWQTKIYGIEAFADYRNALWDYAYDKVIVGDAAECLPQLPDADLIVVLDVWEHFQRDYGERFREMCLAKADYLLVCTPIEVHEQGAVFDNEYERHVSEWTPDDFRDVKHRLVASTGFDWVLLLSNKKAIPYEVWRRHRRWEHFLRGWRAFRQVSKHKNW